MKDISFFSEDEYLYIPNAKNPKVILAIGNKVMAKNAFQLYNPFSSKAKSYKKVVGFLCAYCNSFVKKFLNLQQFSNTEFIQFLNEKYQKKFTSSVYYATLKDKVVLQLQSNSQVFGYVKYPLNSTGLKNIKNEIKALQLLSSKNIIGYNADAFEFKKTPFFVLPELKGDIKNIADNDVKNILKRYYKGDFYLLKKHPRVLEICSFFEEHKFEDFVFIIKNIQTKISKKYADVYEHGDFAPWNIVKTDGGFSAFDFEYFSENGLEYFDLIKYHFQVGRLLKGKTELELQQYLQSKLQIENTKEIVQLFLLKEIMIAIQQQKSYDFEKDFLTFLHD